jgi:hypothetical protein
MRNSHKCTQRIPMRLAAQTAGVQGGVAATVGDEDEQGRQVYGVIFFFFFCSRRHPRFVFLMCSFLYYCVGSFVAGVRLAVGF